MLYLASQFAWFLLAAFALGWVMGWLGSAQRIRLASGPLPYLAGIWLLLAALTWLQGVNGAAALWVETALLYLAAYLAGCILASTVRAAAVPKTMELAIAGAPAGMDRKTEAAGPPVALVEDAPPAPESDATAPISAADDGNAAGDDATPTAKKNGRKNRRDKPAGSKP